MKNTVTVDQAIQRGQLLCNMPTILFLAGPGILCLYLKLDTPYTIAAFAAGFISAWLYWGLIITYWRLWAFERVKNIPELKKAAIEAKLIWPDGHFFEKTEIRSKAQRNRLRLLENKLVVDKYTDDPKVPDTTILYFSKSNARLELIGGIACLAFAVFLYLTANTPKARFFAYIAPLLGVWYIYKGIKKLRDTNPQLVLSDKGIETKEKGSIDWEDIYDEKIIVRRNESILSYYHSGGEIDIEVDKIDISVKDLKHLLKVYRGRYEQNL
jgi:hypothetical protein